jgi:hypothetical protein
MQPVFAHFAGNAANNEPDPTSVIIGVLIGVAIALTIAICFLSTLSKALTRCHRENRTMGPGMCG